MKLPRKLVQPTLLKSTFELHHTLLTSGVKLKTIHLHQLI